MKSTRSDFSPESLLPEFYEAHYSRLLSTPNKSSYLDTAVTKANQHHANLNLIMQTLQNASLNIEERLKKIETGIGMNLSKYEENSMKEYQPLTIEMMTLTQKIRSAEPKINYFEYRSTSYQDKLTPDLFNFDKLNNDILEKYAGKQIDQKKLDSILYPSSSYPTNKHRQAGMRKHKKAMRNAQKVLAKYKKSGKPIVFSELSKKDFEALKEGLDARRYLTINLNNYLVSMVGVKDETIEKQKILLEELNAVVVNRDLDPARANEYEKELQGKDRKEIQHIVNSLKEEQQVLKNQSRDIEIYMGYLSNVQVAIGKTKFAVAKERIETLLEKMPTILTSPRSDALIRIDDWFKRVRNSKEGVRYLNDEERPEQREKFFAQYVDFKLKMIEKNRDITMLNAFKKDIDVQKYLRNHPKINVKIFNLSGELLKGEMAKMQEKAAPNNTSLTAKSMHTASSSTLFHTTQTQHKSTPEQKTPPPVPPRRR